MFIAALFVIARTWKQPRCPSIEGEPDETHVVLLLEIGHRQESQVTFGDWGLGGLLEGERVREKGVGEEWGKLGGLGWGREEGWIWDQGRLYLN